MGHCLDCGTTLRGRTDKKFCNDYCRGHYHNHLNRDRYALLNEINSILRKNEAILERFKRNGVTRLTTGALTAAGFNFNFFTHQQRDSSGALCNYCYQHGYQQVNHQELILIADAGAQAKPQNC